MNAIETIEYKKHLIEIYQDGSPMNPFVDWDSEPDIIVYDGLFTEYGNTSVDILPELTDMEIRNNVSILLDLVDYKTLLQFTTDWAYRYRSNYQTAREMVRDSLQEYYENLPDYDKLEFLGAIHQIKGIVTLCDSRCGYSQGDFVEVLVIASDSFCKRTGAQITEPDQLRPSIDLYAAWAFGDVYGFIVTYDNDEIDSCWGFYGSDHEKSGLVDAAKEVIDHEAFKKFAIEEKRKYQRQQKLKGQIKNHVPLEYR